MLKRLATRDSNTCKQLDATNMDAKATESANERTEDSRWERWQRSRTDAIQCDAGVNNGERRDGRKDVRDGKVKEMEVRTEHVGRRACFAR